MEKIFNYIAMKFCEFNKIHISFCKTVKYFNCNKKYLMR